MKVSCKPNLMKIVGGNVFEFNRNLQKVGYKALAAVGLGMATLYLLYRVFNVPCILYSELLFKNL